MIGGGEEPDSEDSLARAQIALATVASVHQRDVIALLCDGASLGLIIIGSHAPCQRSPTRFEPRRYSVSPARRRPGRAFCRNPSSSRKPLRSSAAAVATCVKCFMHMCKMFDAWRRTLSSLACLRRLPEPDWWLRGVAAADLREADSG